MSRDYPIYGTHEEGTLEQMDNVMESANKGALMADGHLGYIMPIGGVAAYEDKVSPAGVGYDIACGNKAARLDLLVEDLKDLPKILDELETKLSFGIGQKNKVIVDHDLFDDWRWCAYDKQYRDGLKELAREQLGTIGSGNHYVDIFAGDDGYVWVGVHFGSRGLGHKTCTGFINLAVTGSWADRVTEQEVLLSTEESLGARYIMAMELAGKYAYAGRDWAVQTVADTIGAPIDWEVHNHHNFAWYENHNNQYYYVIRKGATPAFPGQFGFVGGSMGDDAVIIEGVDSEESRTSLYSTVHGAGRVMSRTKAAGKLRWKRLEEGKPKVRVQVSEGEISKDMMYEWLTQKGVLLRGGGTDESPHVYRRLPEVLEEHRNTIKIVHTLKPLAVMMAGANEFDPYKD